MELTSVSPFVDSTAALLKPGKFIDPERTLKGERRASVTLDRLTTLWLNTGTLCNLACKSCYIESSPRNDALLYLTLEEADRFLDELSDPIEIGLTGGEPFMNPDIIRILDSALRRGHRVLVLTNAMRPMQRHQPALLELAGGYPGRLSFRVSLDHYTKAVHEAERGPNTWDKAIAGLGWIAGHGLRCAVAGRLLPGECEAESRSGYARLFRAIGLNLDADDPASLVLFPEMEATADVPEISESCWSILGLTPAVAMCHSSRMIVHRKGSATAEVAACTLLPYDEQFILGTTLGTARRDVSLNHPHCARFCVLGGASCSA